jgi:hypothetical protein
MKSEDLPRLGAVERAMRIQREVLDRKRSAWVEIQQASPELAAVLLALRDRFGEIRLEYCRTESTQLWPRKPRRGKSRGEEENPV